MNKGTNTVTSRALLEKMTGLVPELYKGLLAENGVAFGIMGLPRDMKKDRPLIVACPDGETFIANCEAITKSMFDRKKITCVFYLSEVWLSASNSENYMERASKAANRENGLMFALINPSGGVECATLFRVANDGQLEKVTSVGGDEMIDRKELINKGTIH